MTKKLSEEITELQQSGFFGDNMDHLGARAAALEERVWSYAYHKALDVGAKHLEAVKHANGILATL